MRLRQGLGVFIGLPAALPPACGDGAPTGTPKVSSATTEGGPQADVITPPAEGEAAGATGEPEFTTAPAAFWPS